ncbi:MAG: LLM class flavin-dependent oxidoreductase [Microbacterium sp.]
MIDGDPSSSALRFGLPWQGPEFAAEAEAAGIAAFCTGEFVDHDAYTVLTEMALGTREALVGPAIAYAFTRTPYAHATAVRSLWQHAPGRIFLGLGSGAFRVNRDWFGVASDRPVERMTDLVGAVRAWLHAENGEPVRYEGEYYRIDANVGAPVLGRLDVPILLAGFNRRMAAAAASAADGVIGHGLFTERWWADVVRPALERGAARAERAAPPVEHGWLITAIDDDDPERAVADARRMIGFYLTVKTYDPFVEHHGWTAQVEQVRTAFRSRDMAAMAAAVTDDMVAEIAVCGSTEDARSALARRRDSIARDVVYLAPPSFLVSPRRKQAYARASLALATA